MEDNRSDSDEEDLEALRLAALATLKPRTINKNEGESPQRDLRNSPNPVIQTALHPRKEPGPSSAYAWRNSAARRGRGRGGFPKMNQRSNLIVITPVGAENDFPEKNPAPQLLLPQHKWCQAANENSSSPKTYSKRGPTRFNRHESGSESSDSDYDDNSDQDSYSNETILQDENSMSFQDESIDRESTPVTDEVNDNHRLNFPIITNNSASSSNLNDPIQREPTNYSSYHYTSQQTPFPGTSTYQNEIIPNPVNGGSAQEYDESRHRLSESNLEGYSSANFVDPNLSQSDLRLELKRRMLKLRRESAEGPKSESCSDKPVRDKRRTSEDSARGYSRDRNRIHEWSGSEMAADGRIRNRSRSLSHGRYRSQSRSLSRIRSRSRSQSSSHSRNRSRSSSRGRNRSRSLSPRHSDRQQSGSRERSSKRCDRNMKRDYSESPDQRRNRRLTRSPDKNGKRSWSRSPVKTLQRISASPTKNNKRVHSGSPEKNNKLGQSSEKSNKLDYIWSPEINKKQNIAQSPQKSHNKRRSRSPDRGRRHNYSRTPEQGHKRHIGDSPERTSIRNTSRSPERKTKHNYTPDKNKKHAHTHSPVKSRKRISPPRSSKASKSSRSPHKNRQRSSTRSPNRFSKVRKRSRTRSPVRSHEPDSSRSPNKSRKKSPSATSEQKHKRKSSRSPRRDPEPRHKRNLSRSPKQILKSNPSPHRDLKPKLNHNISHSPEKINSQLHSSRSPIRDRWRDSSESSEHSDRDWRGKKNTSRRWSRSSSANSSNSESSHGRSSRLKSISSVVKPVLSSVSAVSIVGSKDDRLFNSDYLKSEKDMIEEKPKALMSLVKSSVIVGENRNNAPDMGKRLPVHMRLGTLPRNKLIRMTKDVEAAFVNSSSDENGETGAEGKKQNFRVVADTTSDVSKRRVEKSPAKNESKSRRKKTYR